MPEPRSPCPFSLPFFLPSGPSILLCPLQMMQTHVAATETRSKENPIPSRIHHTEELTPHTPSCLDPCRPYCTVCTACTVRVDVPYPSSSYPYQAQIRHASHTSCVTAIKRTIARTYGNGEQENEGSVVKQASKQAKHRKALSDPSERALRRLMVYVNAKRDHGKHHFMSLDRSAQLIPHVR